MGTSGRCKWVNVYSYKFSAKILDAGQSMIVIIYFFSCCKFQGDGQDWKKKRAVMFSWPLVFSNTPIVSISHQTVLRCSSIHLTEEIMFTCQQVVLKSFNQVTVVMQS